MNWEVIFFNGEGRGICCTQQIDQDAYSHLLCEWYWADNQWSKSCGVKTASVKRDTKGEISEIARRRRALISGSPMGWFPRAFLLHLSGANPVICQKELDSGVWTPKHRLQLPVSSKWPFPSLSGNGVWWGKKRAHEDGENLQWETEAWRKDAKEELGTQEST